MESLNNTVREVVTKFPFLSGLSYLANQDILPLDKRDSPGRSMLKIVGHLIYPLLVTAWIIVAQDTGSYNPLIQLEIMHSRHEKTRIYRKHFEDLDQMESNYREGIGRIYWEGRLDE